MKYKNEIIEISNEYGVDSALIASIANVESGFRENAKSNKGAVGVMQLRPSTAKWMADKNKIDYDENRLGEGEYNIRIGALYLSYLLKQFGDKTLAICAYNAGPGNVSAWLKNGDNSKDGKRLDKIPFKETERYLNKVNKNYYYYKNRYK